jgi:hypothetical protein
VSSRWRSGCCRTRSTSSSSRSKSTSSPCISGDSAGAAARAAGQRGACSPTAE